MWLCVCFSGLHLFLQTGCSSGGAPQTLDLSGTEPVPDPVLDQASGPIRDLSEPPPDLQMSPGDMHKADGGVVPPLPFRPIAAAKFQMGRLFDMRCWSSVENAREVTLTRGFELMTTEVTQAQFEALLGYNPAAFKTCGADCPVEQVSWHEAVAFCNALSLRRGLTPCYECSGARDTSSCAPAPAFDGAGIYTCPGFRLPTDAEWELAYRSGTRTEFHSGPMTECHSSDANLDLIGWYKANSDSRPHPVGGKLANASGLFDLSGNVWEWAHDLWDGTPEAKPVTDPVGSRPGSRVLRGGAWDSAPWFSTASYRYGNPPTTRDNRFGFRCARTL